MAITCCRLHCSLSRIRQRPNILAVLRWKGIFISKQRGIVCRFYTRNPIRGRTSLWAA